MVTELSPTPPTTGPAVGAPTVTVVVCAYTEARWDTLVGALGSLRDQRRVPEQLVVVVDHNEGLLARAVAAFGHDVEVVPNDDRRGLAGARNTGVRRARGDVVAFLDDDAAADPGWLEAMLVHYADPRVAGVGGAVVPVWRAGRRPAWFPVEFDWVVGCTHAGLPDVAAPVRNPVGASMSIRRWLFDAVGGFDTAMGRVGSVPLGCEETEFAVRVSQRVAGVRFMHEPEAVAHHFVVPERARVGYFLRRCYAEGLSKSAVSSRAGADDALSSERFYAAVTLPAAMAGQVVRALRGDVMGLARMAMMVGGLAAAAAGYGAARLVAPFSAPRTALRWRRG